MQDVLCTIVSKLPLKEVSRTSVLSSSWRYIWSICRPKLCFCFYGYYDDPHEKEQYSQKFVEKVNAVLRKYDGKVIEEFDVKIEFDAVLSDHLNNWLTFAVLSRTKNLTFDLNPAVSGRSGDRHTFPFHLLDRESISSLQRTQLSFLSFRPPPDFRGFPNLRKLDLNLVHLNREDLEVMLHGCRNLEWLSLVRCYLNGKLKLCHPLSRLAHLTVIQCGATMVEIHVPKLANFKYDGDFVTIAINPALKLENAHVWFFKATFEDALSALLNGIPSIQNLTLHICWLRIEVQMPSNTHIFSHLRHLQLLMNIKLEYANKVPYVVSSLMRAAPFLQKLEVHFGGNDKIWFADQGPGMPQLMRREYSCLKDVHITGYKGARCQIELLLLENAPALEAFTVDTTQVLYEDYYFARIGSKFSECAAVVAREFLRRKLPTKVKLHVM
uniref:F-box domain-containing protein n=1 Tax=Oryza punctata TaxID=4537 RepID=A0A0E0KG18_ORYPU